METSKESWLQSVYYLSVVLCAGCDVPYCQTHGKKNEEVRNNFNAPACANNFEQSLAMEALVICEQHMNLLLNNQLSFIYKTDETFMFLFDLTCRTLNQEIYQIPSGDFLRDLLLKFSGSWVEFTVKDYHQEQETNYMFN